VADVLHCVYRTHRGEQRTERMRRGPALRPLGGVQTWGVSPSAVSQTRARAVEGVNRLKRAGPQNARPAVGGQGVCEFS
jgi:hypothetical protein